MEVMVEPQTLVQEVLVIRLALLEILSMLEVMVLRVLLEVCLEVVEKALVQTEREVMLPLVREVVVEMVEMEQVVLLQTAHHRLAQIPEEVERADVQQETLMLQVEMVVLVVHLFLTHSLQVLPPPSNSKSLMAQVMDLLVGQIKSLL
jgi:hypothetical protein